MILAHLLACQGEDSRPPPADVTPSDSGSEWVTAITGPPDTAVDGVDSDHDGADGPVMLLSEVATLVVTSPDLFEQLGYTVACSEQPVGGHASALVGGTFNESGTATGRTHLFAGDLRGEGTPSELEFYRIEGEPQDHLGDRGVLLPGDLNGDGQGDVLASALQDRAPDPLTGAVYAFDPSDGTLGTPSGAFARYVGPPVGQREFGGLGAAGDVDGDGVPDLWLSDTAWVDEATPGDMRLYSGAEATGTVLPDQAIATVRGADPLSPTGLRVSTSDITGDGTPDLVVGEFRWVANTGRIVVAPGPVLGLGPNALDESAIRVEEPAEVGGEIGLNFDIGDLSGDGVPDLVVPAHVRAGPLGDRQGAVFVFFGPLDRTVTTAEADLTIRGETDFQMFGLDAVVGDHDGDGQLDLIVAAPTDPTFGPPRPGLVYVFRGPIAAAAELPASSATVVYRGFEAYEVLGKSLAACDLDHDGSDEIVVGAPFTAGQSGRVIRIPGR